MSAEVRTLRTARDNCAASVIPVLRDLLEKAERGEVIAVTGIAEYRGGTYGHFGSATMSRLQTSGALLEAAINRLGDE